MSGDGKLEKARELGIDYVYSTRFDCDNLEFVGASSEGLFLYEVVR